jgi:hypothetical protein
MPAPELNTGELCDTERPFSKNLLLVGYFGLISIVLQMTGQVKEPWGHT